MPSQPRFDPDQVAYYEKAGWEAYYDRNWPRAFWLLVQLNRAAFGMSWLAAVAGAVDSVRASMAFAPLDNDVPRARQFLERFFERARRSLDIRAEAKKLAELEMDYWVVHRQLAIERQQQPDHPEANDIEPMVQALAVLHAALFESTPDEMRPSAELRALAAKTVDRITSRTSTDVAGDWRQVEHYLRQAYRAVQAVRQ